MRPLPYDKVVTAAAAIKKHGSKAAAAREMGVPVNTLKHWLDSAKRLGIDATDAPTRLPQTADECWAALDAAIGRSAKDFTSRKYVPGRTKRIAIAGDFHCPFQDDEAVARLFAVTEGYDQLIINGDLTDMYAISRFVHYEAVPFEREIAAADAILGQASKHYPDVLVVDGNHDKPRFEKQLRALLSLEMIHVIEYLSGGNLSAIRTLAKRYQNVRFADHRVGRHHLGWFAQEGDLLVCHAEKFSRVPGSALRTIEEWFADRGDVLGLAPWKVLIQAHTHQLGAIPWHSDLLLVEGGCLCQTHGYQLTAGMGGRPQRLGFVTLTQHDGVTDRDTVKWHWIDASRAAEAAAA